MKRIEIIVSLSGETIVETKGFRGEQCREASRLLEAALGCKTAETLTAEYHEQSVEERNQLENWR
ncbi:MAG: DUF2997 domain-containing protein [Planctomycetales bacterium]|nr:DUF2997 domain-containing protein [Planctomycetales bacterium]